MAVYREGYIFIEDLQKRTKQIWNDSCDAGVLVKKGDKNWNMAKQLVDWYREAKYYDNDVRIETPTNIHREYGSTSSVISATARVELMDEWAFSDGRKTEEEATDLFEVVYIPLTNYDKRKPSFIDSNKDWDGFIYINKLRNS